ncbi:YolD-like family protein [Cytobacillus gottheilii]|uniref:YolD-like family protein n=1 Tax=Cytobacillus gottheilii TaxID=859144 RepID=UPI002493D479|nr:YolD-like family protein [Cytobacillus gottheilii]
MILDKELLKLTSFLLPNQMELLTPAEMSEEQCDLPNLDEQRLEKIELIISDAMEFSSTIQVTLFNDGVNTILQGMAHYINERKSQIILQDLEGHFYHIPLKNILSIEPK